MTPIQEGALLFEFGSSWRVVKYDDEPTYRKRIASLSGEARCTDEACRGDVHCQVCKKRVGLGTRAVDIIGCRGDQLYLIEIKDFRGHRIENKKRLISGDLPFEVALKVRDTLAGMVGALYSNEAEAWEPFVEPIFRKRAHEREPPRVLLWLEEDMNPDRVEKRGPPALDVADRLRRHLRWLTPKVFVINQQKLRPEQLDLTVTMSARCPPIEPPP